LNDEGVIIPTRGAIALITESAVPKSVHFLFQYPRADALAEARGCVKGFCSKVARIAVGAPRF